MSKTIRTYNDLCEERERVKNLLVVQKQRMRDDWDGLKNEFLPVTKVFGVMGKMSSPNKNMNPLMNKSLKVAMNLFITKFVLGKAGWLTKLAVPYILSNYSTHVIADKGQTFISRVASFLNNKKKYGIKEQRVERKWQNTPNTTSTTSTPGTTATPNTMTTPITPGTQSMGITTGGRTEPLGGELSGT